MKKILKGIKNSLTNNISVKILALVLATLLWLAVVNVSDPEKTVTLYNIPITITHESAITKANMVYKVKSKTYVNVTVSGKRSVISELKSEDFTATASLAELSALNSVPVVVEINDRTIARRVNIVRQNIQNILLSTEKKDKRTYDLDISYDGVPMEGFIVGGYELSKKSVSVKAPVSVLNKINNVVARCKLSGESDSVVKKCNVILLDDNGNEIKADSVELSASKVQADISIVPSKEIPIKISTQGEVAKGYAITATTISPETVFIFGKNGVDIGSINELTISDAIDVSHATKSITKRIELSSYLPYDVEVANSIEYADVVIEISKMGEKKLTVPTKDIKINNLANGQTAKLQGEKYEVTFVGKETNVSKLKNSDIEFSVDINKIKKNKVDLEVKTPEGITLKGKVKIKVLADKK